MHSNGTDDPTPVTTTAPMSPPEPISRRAAERAALVEDVEWMASTGETMAGAAARLHVHPDTLCTRLDRAGRRDLWASLLANGDPTWTGYRGPTGSIRRHTRSRGRAA